MLTLNCPDNLVLLNYQPGVVTAPLKQSTNQYRPEKSDWYPASKSECML